jgi:hypothetical protein
VGDLKFFACPTRYQVVQDENFIVLCNNAFDPKLHHIRALKITHRRKPVYKSGKVGMVALSVLLLTKNGVHDLERLLPALYDQKGAGPLEVIAVDSGSAGTVELLQRHPLHLEQIPAETFHHARTQNFAAGLAQGEILIFLSQDAIPTSDLWLSKLISNFDDVKGYFEDSGIAKRILDRGTGGLEYGRMW